MPEPLIPAEWANGLMEMIRNNDWNSWNAHDRKVEIIQVFSFKIYILDSVRFEKVF